MIIGDPRRFALEFGLTKAYDQLGFRALGFFVMHVDGRRYGVYEPDATLLACSFDAVERRIRDRGQHTAPFASEPDAGGIADAFRSAIYTNEARGSFYGLSLAEFKTLLYDEPNELNWAPDGDEAFDDSSYVLQFDVQNRVRIIAFRAKDGRNTLHDPATLSDVWLPADDFYDVLRKWRDAFESEWASMPKSDSGEELQ